MNSTRILLSDRHFHDLRLSEMEIGLLLNALNPLLYEVSDGKELIRALHLKLLELLDQPVSHSTVPEEEEREWRKFFR